MSNAGTRHVTLSPRGRRAVQAVALLGVVVGVILGMETLILHLSTDPLVDTRRYYEAGRRLNEGLPLYGQVSEDTTATFLNPPLLAILFRPLALLPFSVAAAIWQAVVVASLVLTFRRAGMGRPMLIVAAWLALPICWALAIGQVEIVLTLLLAIGSPLAVAVAGSVKLFPWLVAIYWLGRRQWSSLVRLAAWIVGLFAFQLVVEPAATMAFLRLEWLDATMEVNNVSLWVIHPLLWLVGALLAAFAAVRLARTRWGWPAAVVMTVMANPRLLVYQLTSLLAAFAGPDRAEATRAPGPDPDHR